MCRRRGMIATWALVLTQFAALNFGCGSGSEPISGVPAQAAEGELERSKGTAATSESDAAPNGSSADSNAKTPSMTANPFPQTLPAPSLDGGVAWINAAGPIDLQDLRGKFVLLDFWTYCCINCLHVLPELKKIERAYPSEVVVIGVHSAKFDGEKDSQNIRDAVMRYEIEHPVINDANHVVWDKFGANSWPTICVIDPEGKLVARQSGEVPFEALDAFFKRALPYYRERGLLDETPVRFDLEAYQARRTPLRFPGKLLADEQGNRLFISDSNHNRIVVADLDGKLLYVIGSGEIGSADGDFSSASFDHPQGLALQDEVLYVADTENHLLRKIDLAARNATTIAGTGVQGRNPWPGIDNAVGALGASVFPKKFVGKPRETALNSPWDVHIHEEDLYIAMAGPHQIWRMPLDESEIGPYAGNGREDIVDGPLLPKAPYELGYSSFAQPSGLASDGKWLYVADSEGSSIRMVPFDSSEDVRTLIGTAHLDFARLFTFGDRDGDSRTALLQHALGVEFHNGSIFVADTYNNKIKVIDAAGNCRTLVGTGAPGQSDQPAEFDEPAGISLADGKLFVADTNNHLVRIVDLEDDNRVSTLSIQGLNAPSPDTGNAVENGPRPEDEINLEPVALLPGDDAVHLSIETRLPAGYKLNNLAPMRYRIVAAQETGPIVRDDLGKYHRIERPAKKFEIKLPLSANDGTDRISVDLFYYYCREGAEGLCKMGSVRWNVPIELTQESGLESLALVTGDEEFPALKQ